MSGGGHRPGGADLARLALGELRALGLAVAGEPSEDLLVTIPGPAGRDAEPAIVLCAPAAAPEGMRALLGTARRLAAAPPPVGVELLLTGDPPCDTIRPRAAVGVALDHAGAIGEVVAAGPEAYRVEAAFTGAAADPARHPEAGRSAVRAAARAVAAVPVVPEGEPLTFVEPVGAGGDPARSIVVVDVRSLAAERAEAAVAAVVDAMYDAANDPRDPADADVCVERRAGGAGRRDDDDPAVATAVAALRSRGYATAAVSTLATSIAAAVGPGVVPIGTGRPVDVEDRDAVEQRAAEHVALALALIDAAASRPSSS